MKLVGKGRAGLWCLFAAALSKRVKAVEADLRGFNPSQDAAWQGHIDVPAIRQLGGLAPVFALIGKRPLELHGATPAVRRLVKKYAR